MIATGPGGSTEKMDPADSRRLARARADAAPFAYRRRRTHVVMVGDVGVGGDHPIRVQSMTTTRTLDTEATVAQAERLARVGCEIVRITAPTAKDARNLGAIKKQLRARGVTVPLVADIHFSPEAALEAANHVEKVRINPGNYADVRKFAVRSYTDAEYAAELGRIEERFAPLVLKCKENRVALRIGTNHGSLSDRIMNRFGDTPEGMVESALEFVRIAEKYGFFDVILSMKASNPKVMIAAYRLLAARMAALGMTYPFHLGVTEAGNGIDGRIKSTIGIGSLLADGIGDTIRVSLTEEPEAEIPVAFLLANHFAPDRRGEGCDEERRSREGREGPAREGAKARPDGESVLSPLLRERQSAPVGAPSEEGARAGAEQPEAPGDHLDRRGSSLSPQPAPCWDPFHYERRASRAVRIGPVTVGGGSVVAVAARAGADGAARARRWASPGNRRLPRPEIVEWPVADAAALSALHDLRQRLEEARALPYLATAGIEFPKLAFLASGSKGTWLDEALPDADGVLLQDPDPAVAAQLARATRAAGKALWLEARVADGGAGSGKARGIDAAVAQVLAAARAARAVGQADLVLAVGADTAESLIYGQRLLIARLAEQGDDTPIFLRSAPAEQPLITAALPLGSLLCDGFGDVIQARTVEGGQDEAVLTLNVLQAAGTRLSKTDYVACPSCGRTLFDLQSTTERIKAKTAHLAGVKIAIMGCVVNGPGEMADADFGYVGGAPGQVNLYFGKTCVERNVPAEIADTKLIELIKSRGRWQEPEPDGEAGAEGAGR